VKKIFVSGLVALLLTACFGSSEEKEVSEISNTIQVGEVQNTLITLSETFAQQLQAFGFEFGDFSTTSSFLGLVDARNVAKTDILENGSYLFTVFEFQLPAEKPYAELIAQIESALPEGDLKPAAFGEGSFYFVQDNVTTNILDFGESVLAFRFDPRNFEEIRDFITSLLILR